MTNQHHQLAPKRLAALVCAAVCALGLLCLPGCGQDAENDSGMPGYVSVISREDGSGTRDAFTSLLGIVDEEDMDATTVEAFITNATSVMMTTVASDPGAIGYISLGSLNDTVKDIQINGVAISADTVKDGSYPVARPFNVVAGPDLSPAAKDFMAFVMSAQGQAVVEEVGYVSVNDNAAAYKPAKVEGKVVVAGSSSVTPVMEKLGEAYEALNPEVSVEVQQSDSSTGVQSASQGICDLGMASRDLKESELALGVESTAVAMDGIAVIVNNDSLISDLTAEQVRSIFTGEITSWETLV